METIQTHFIEILIKIQSFAFQKMHLNVFFATYAHLFQVLLC